MVDIWRTGFEPSDPVPYFGSNNPEDIAEIIAAMTGNALHLRKTSTATNFEGPFMVAGALNSPTNVYSVRFPILIPTAPLTGYTSLCQIWNQQNEPYSYQMLSTLYLSWDNGIVTLGLRKFLPVDDEVSAQIAFTAGTTHTLEIAITRGANGKVEAFVDDVLVATNPADFSTIPEPNYFSIGQIDCHFAGIDFYVDDVVLADAVSGTAPPTCPTGYHWDAATQSCVKDTITPTPNSILLPAIIVGGVIVGTVLLTR